MNNENKAWWCMVLQSYKQAYDGRLLILAMLIIATFPLLTKNPKLQATNERSSAVCRSQDPRSALYYIYHTGPLKFKRYCTHSSGSLIASQLFLLDDATALGGQAFQFYWEKALKHNLCNTALQGSIPIEVYVIMRRWSP